jgi:putative ABC transport system substrate-binding protein
MKRREFITLFGGAAVTWPIAARGQQPAIPIVGFLDPVSLEAGRAGVAEFRKGLEEAGYVEGRNVAIEFRWGNNQGTLSRLAADLVERQVNVIVASGGISAVLAAKAATSTIPIVFAGGADPVKYGLVASLNRPGGNITGVTSIHNELAGKRLDLLRELVPPAKPVGYLVGDQHGETQLELTSDLLAAARSLGRQVIVLECRSEHDFEVAFATLLQRKAGALVVSAFPLAYNNRNKILALAARHKIPAIYPQSPYVYAGGLMSYGALGTLRQVGSDYVPRILEGANPADLPIQQPTRFELIINLKTAKVLGLTMPSTLLVSADKVIE